MATRLLDAARGQVGLERAQRPRELGELLVLTGDWPVWVSKPPQWIVMIRVPRLAASRCAAVRSRVDSVELFG